MVVEMNLKLSNLPSCQVGYRQVHKQRERTPTERKRKRERESEKDSCGLERGQCNV